MNCLFVSMTGREKRLGWCLILPALAVTALLSRTCKSALSLPLISMTLLPATLFVFRRFLRESAQVPFTGLRSILKMALLGLMAAQLITLLINDLLFFFFPKYYLYDETGPHFIHAQRELLAAALGENPILTALCTVFALPVVSEVFHRGLVFGSIPTKSRILACLAATAVFGGVRILFLPDAEPAYLVISFLQYVPMGIFFTWVYTGTETISTPILAHMLLNAVSIYTMR